MLFSNKIRLFWWNEKVIQGKSKENYGDVLGKYLVEKISKKIVVFAWPKKFSILDFAFPIYVTIGSILGNVNHKCIVWGSGIIDRKIKIKKAVFLAVRGPQTRKYLVELGCDVPEIYGDPALLLPRYFNPKIEKKYKFGFVPHYNDYKQVQEWFKDNPEVLLIDMMTNDVEEKTVEFLQCEKIISSSLHGIIMAHAYGIPAVWQKFSDKVFGDDIKYQDYMESVEIPFYKPEIKTTAYSSEQMEALFNAFPNLPQKQKIEELCDGLMKVCPFK
ncbi:polysaccharide pyruvyl transferase family protein [Flavobacterium hungaricum]|uniref:Polysaccharide pyruvyl transferase family protein n=1 Tax=Flavobacterium hungaricum TaxID=2082725 RepID=A0ABR9TQX6_9FLAO|nr:polysaccharide pyruvyl transferase family protein [Flavobacterium hungaricum]MBE8727787.1 polysaccharide pyruvyl transferase family protein [Flavobacterium hungaricum]